MFVYHAFSFTSRKRVLGLIISPFYWSQGFDFSLLAQLFQLHVGRTPIKMCLWLPLVGILTYLDIFKTANKVAGRSWFQWCLSVRPQGEGSHVTITHVALDLTDRPPPLLSVQ